MTTVVTGFVQGCDFLKHPHRAECQPEMSPPQKRHLGTEILVTSRGPESLPLCYPLLQGLKGTSGAASIGWVDFFPAVLLSSSPSLLEVTAVEGAVPCAPH